MFCFRYTKKGFTLIELMVGMAIIALLALFGLRVYSGQQEKAELADRNINRGEAVNIVKAAGLHNPFNGVDMNTAGWFPESAGVPGEIQITLSSGIFSIQGYGADGLLPDILTARR